MDEEISIINSNTRNEKIKNFFIKNKKLIVGILLTILLIIFTYFFYAEIKDRKFENLSEKYNNIVINFENLDKKTVTQNLIEIINEENSTYSPLALYFIIDNNLEVTNDEINNFFDIIINKTNLNKEIKNLVIYKKGLFNSEFETENNLLKILNPIINSESVWKSHALYLVAEYFFHKNEKQKAKEFYIQILEYKKSNEKIIQEAQKRLNRDFSE